MWKGLIKTNRQKEFFKKAERIAEEACKHLTKTDREASFSYETLKVIKDVKYPSMSLAKSEGGEGLSLYELLLMQEKIAEGDGAAALSIGWHMGIMMELSQEQLWDKAAYDRLVKQVVTDQKVVNRAATEPATGSPTRGGVPETKAVKQGDQYRLNGRKSFTSMAEHLDFYIVSAYVEDKDTVGWFLIDRHQAGLSIDKTWDTLGMRGTASDDLVMNDVKVNEGDLVELKSEGKPNAKGWLLHIPACYLGIAVAARNDAIAFAKDFQPNSLNTPIAEVAHIQDKIGEMEWKLMQAHSFLYSTAKKWDEEPEQRGLMGSELAAVKLAVTNTANEVVDLAMRIAGGRGLSKKYPFEKYYRDVRAGLHNPPMDDAVIAMLAKQAISKD
ncbi:Acyl-CoA dehydrogenase [Halobacillus karajensis]|uniref:Acyl-CoA dehydrogenase YdbM n=1 Tax=Halobacillus karajensis TaxID=195088 RepID=A0A024P9V1_9BACI|nr:acyl-CoA dehydrogenase family protein [Halobacillus karajensis]CDQ21586.1 Putative acyl-CoA dehydrogenase YdbM [Halobacillus karajensis]CDQ25521.1 Putative acyl-CoA dehydrogenase YdbM [Halobacillus karajensis]CDQ28949.1 Putative acyl-CoA dehydrogenase YdbM [Halobacillus karajensis]SEI08724.1 Acyl-CoA dehydrogenase [Halobacillus karajensis]